MSVTRLLAPWCASSAVALLAAACATTPKVAAGTDCTAVVAAATAADVEGAVAPRPSIHNEKAPFPADSGVPRQGEVTVRFVVDPAGRPDVSTIEIPEATHQAFANAVRSVVPTWRFRPARLRASSCPVRYPYTTKVTFERDESTDPKPEKGTPGTR